MTILKPIELEAAQALVKETYSAELEKLAIICMLKPIPTARCFRKYLKFGIKDYFYAIIMFCICSYIPKHEKIISKLTRGWYKPKNIIPDSFDLKPILNSLEDSFNVVRWFKEFKVDLGDGNYITFEYVPSKIKDSFKLNLMDDLLDQIQNYWESINKSMDIATHNFKNHRKN